MQWVKDNYSLFIGLALLGAVALLTFGCTPPGYDHEPPRPASPLNPF